MSERNSEEKSNERILGIPFHGHKFKIWDLVMETD